MNRVLFIATLMAPAVCGAEPWERHTVDASSRGADGVRLADVNRDGLPDIATGWEEGGKIRVYLHPGPARVRQGWPRVTVGNIKSPEDAVFADLDGDGAVDVVSCCEGRTRTVFAHWAPADPASYTDAEAWQTAAFHCTRQKQSWMFALPMEIDGSHGVDLIVGSKGANGSIGWLESPADPRDMQAWRWHPLYEAGWIMSLVAHDMDGDSDLDVLASDRKGPGRGVLWLENPGPAAAGDRWQLHRIGGGDREVMFLCLTDQFASRRHLFTAVRGRGIAVFEQAAADTWSQFEIAWPAGCGTGKAVAVGDIDLDGRQDVVFSCENARDGKSGVRWLASPRASPRHPLAGWQDHEVSGPEGVKFDRLELVDLDRDGDLDVLTCEERDNLGVIWYENPRR